MAARKQERKSWVECLTGLSFSDTMRLNNSLVTFSMAVGFLILPGASGQRLSLGVVAGGHSTDDLYAQFFPASAQGSGYRLDSARSGWLAGASVEVSLRSNLSLEVDSLYRAFHFTESTVLADGSLRSVSPATVVTWQFPVLAKYRFSSRPVKPFVEGGPSFRTTGNLSGTNPSHIGITAGLGVEMGWRGFRISPAARYTRWARDRFPAIRGETVPNQLEFVLGVSRTPASNWKPLGRRFSLGVLLGTNLTNHFRTPVAPEPVVHPDGGFERLDYSLSHALIAGPAVEVTLSEHLSMEVDALYRPIHGPFSTAFLRGVALSYGGRPKDVTWEFPVLAKYRLPARFGRPSMMPLIELGPSFRTPQELNGARLSQYGISAGAGIEVALGRFRISPTVRYIHWAPDSPRARSQVIRNQVALLTAFSF